MVTHTHTHTQNSVICNTEPVFWSSCFRQIPATSSARKQKEMACVFSRNNSWCPDRTLPASFTLCLYQSIYIYIYIYYPRQIQMQCRRLWRVKSWKIWKCFSLLCFFFFSWGISIILVCRQLFFLKGFIQK